MDGIISNGSYTVNWIEQGREPVEELFSDDYETVETERRIVFSSRFWRQSRKRIGKVKHTAVKTFNHVTYRAETVTWTSVNANGGVATRTVPITQELSYEIQGNAYLEGCVTCTTSRESGPNFSVTKVVKLADPLIANTVSTVEWGDWSAWSPTLPGE